MKLMIDQPFRQGIARNFELSFDALNLRWNNVILHYSNYVGCWLCMSFPQQV